MSAAPRGDANACADRRGALIGIDGPPALRTRAVLEVATSLAHDARRIVLLDLEPVMCEYAHGSPSVERVELSPHATALDVAHAAADAVRHGAGAIAIDTISQTWRRALAEKAALELEAALPSFAAWELAMLGWRWLVMRLRALPVPVVVGLRIHPDYAPGTDARSIPDRRSGGPVVGDGFEDDLSAHLSLTESSMALVRHDVTGGLGAGPWDLQALAEELSRHYSRFTSDAGGEARPHTLRAIRGAMQMLELTRPELVRRAARTYARRRAEIEGNEAIATRFLEALEPLPVTELIRLKSGRGPAAPTRSGAARRVA